MTDLTDLSKLPTQFFSLYRKALTGIRPNGPVKGSMIKTFDKMEAAYRESFLPGQSALPPGVKILDIRTERSDLFDLENGRISLDLPGNDSVEPESPRIEHYKETLD